MTNDTLTQKAPDFEGIAEQIGSLVTEKNVA